MSDIEATGGAEAVAPSPADNLSALSKDADFMSDWDGSNGRPAQIAAVERKSALTKAAHGQADEPAPALPDSVQAGLDAPDAVSQAAAAAMVPGQSAEDYKFNWDDSASIELDTLQDMNTTAADAAFAVGASPEYAKATIDGLQTMLKQSSGIEATEATLQEALSKHFGSNADATVEAAKATLAKMPERSRDWAIDTAGQLDASGVAWFVGRLASIHKANASKP